MSLSRQRNRERMRKERNMERYANGSEPGDGSAEAIQVAFRRWQNYGVDPPGHRAPMIWQLHAGHITQSDYDAWLWRPRNGE